MSAYIEVIKLQQLHLALGLNTNLLKILLKSDDSYKEFSPEPVNLAYSLLTGK